MSPRPRATQRKYAWKHDWDAVDWENLTDTEIAHSLGIPTASVTVTRRRQGRPRAPDGRSLRNLGKTLIVTRIEEQLLADFLRYVDRTLGNSTVDAKWPLLRERVTANTLRTYNVKRTGNASDF